MVICLERGADLHMAQLMPLPFTVSCFSKIQIGFTFLVLAHPDSPGQRVVKRMCVLGFITVSVHSLYFLLLMRAFIFFVLPFLFSERLSYWVWLVSCFLCSVYIYFKEKFSYKELQYNSFESFLLLLLWFGWFMYLVNFTIYIYHILSQYYNAVSAVHIKHQYALCVSRW